MKSPRTRRSKKASPDNARKPPGVAHATRRTERLMGQMREANERLIVAAVQAQNLSDEAHLEAARARSAVPRHTASTV